jgi:hypothetical protein
MQEILELRKHGLDRARLVLADYRQHATIVSRKCVRSLVAADNVLIAAHAALVEREIQPSSRSSRNHPPLNQSIFAYLFR